MMIGKLSKYGFLFLLILSLCFKTEAQVTIPDPNFRQFLSNNYPAVITGDQLNTLLAALVTSFTCQNQPVSDFTGLEHFIGLTSITINQTPATKLPSLSSMVALTNLNCSNNQLTELPNLSSNLLLLSLDCSGNDLQTLPDLSLLASLTNADFRNNQLTFEDFLPSLTNPIFNTAFKIHPQDSISITNKVELTEEYSFSYNLDVDNGVNNTIYTWHKNGFLLVSGSSPDLIISSVKKTDEGSYLCLITNSAIPDLTLTTTKLYLQVKAKKGHSPLNEITPDGDGINDFFYIPESGTAKIFDRNGILVKQLSIPNTWDGSTNNYEIGTSGLYLIEINGDKQIKVYLFK